MAADIGGTFTDIVAIRSDGEIRRRKVASSPGDFARATADGIAAAIADFDGSRTTGSAGTADDGQIGGAPRGITGFRVMEAVLGALAQAAPDRVAADGEGGNTLISIGGRGTDRRPFVYTELFAGARGGSAQGDGAEGVPHPGSNNANMPVELAETSYPIRFLQYAIVPDTGGAGRFRGANAQVREFRHLGPTTTIQLCSDKRRFRPYGLAGGEAGSPSLNVIDPGTAGERVLPTIGPWQIRTGEVFRHALAGGGGWGDAPDRDPALVAADIESGKLSQRAGAASLQASGHPARPAGDRERSGDREHLGNRRPSRRRIT